MLGRTEQAPGLPERNCAGKRGLDRSAKLRESPLGGDTEGAPGDPHEDCNDGDNFQSFFLFAKSRFPNPRPAYWLVGRIVGPPSLGKVAGCVKPSPPPHRPATLPHTPTPQSHIMSNLRGSAFSQFELH